MERKGGRRAGEDGLIDNMMRPDCETEKVCVLLSIIVPQTSELLTECKDMSMILCIY